jgi:hypothetical protein
VRLLRLILSLFLVFALLGLPSAALAAPAAAPAKEDIVIFGEDYTLASGESINGNLVLFGGDATVESGALVQGSVVVFGGDVDVDGTVDENVIVIGGDAQIGSHAIIEGDLVNPFGSIDRGFGAQVQGNQVSNIGPGVFREFRWVLGGHLFSGAWISFNTIAMTGVAFLLALFVPEPLRRTASTIATRPGTSGGLGALTFILLPFVLVVTIITCILPPIILLLAIAGGIFGWAALGLEIGRLLARSLRSDWSPVMQATVGTVLLTLVAGLLTLIPFIGWLPGFVLGAAGLGAVLLTRFGTQPQQPAIAASRAGSQSAKPARKRTAR